MGCKKRKMVCEPPPNGFYMVDWSLNELIRRGALSEQALWLWLALKGLAWELGRCDPTDEALCDLLGGVSVNAVRRARDELKALHLMLEHTEGNRRWLTPLPVLRGMAGKLPEPLRSQALAEEALLREALECEKKANSIRLSLKEVKERELTSSLPDLAKGGVGGNPDLPAPPEVLAGGPRPSRAPGGGEGDDETAREGVAAFLRARGVYTAVARKLAGDLLAGRSVQAAQTWALALLLEAREGAATEQHAVGRWVRRMVRGETPERASLARAAEAVGREDVKREGVKHEDVVREEDEDVPVTHHISRFTDQPPLPTLRVTMGGAPRELPPGEAWELALVQLRRQMAQTTWQAYLCDSRAVGLEGDQLVVEVVNAEAVAWLEGRLAPVVLRTLAALTGREMGVRWAARGRQRIRNE